MRVAPTLAISMAQLISKVKEFVLKMHILPALLHGVSLWTSSEKSQRKLTAKENYIPM